MNNKIRFEDWNVWFDMRGSGPIPVLFIPGFLGMAITDFPDQFFGDSAPDLLKYTIVCIELIGYGRSRPPARPYGPEQLNKDVACCIMVMQSLGYHKFSIIGWSEGGRVALRLATFEPNKVDKLVLVASTIFPPKNKMPALMSCLDITKWKPEKIKPFLRIYGQDELKIMWQQYLDYIAKNHDYFPNGICNTSMVKCPTLYIYGDRDIIIKEDQVQMAFNGIGNIILVRFPLAGHDVHKKCQIQFKKLIEIFVD